MPLSHVTESLLILAGYALGSLSSAVIVCRLMGLPDPRGQGSGNPGATNVLRFGGKKAAALVFAGDALKGLIPVLAGKGLAQPPSVIAAVGLAAFIGHLFPVFFRFEGGKGVATALGVWLGISFPVGLLLMMVWLLVAIAFRISSLAAIVSALAAPPLAVWLLNTIPYSVGAGLMTVLLLWRHKGNIRNLVNGTEPRIGGKRTGTTSG